MPRRFIEKNVDIIEDGNYDTLYDIADEDLAQYQVGELTKTLWDIGEHPEAELSYIPSAYFAEWEMREYKIPDNIKEIRSFAFVHCEQLKELWIPKSVTKIGTSFVYGCNSLKTIHYEGDKKDAINILMAPGTFNGTSTFKFICEADGHIFSFGGKA